VAEQRVAREASAGTTMTRPAMSLQRLGTSLRARLDTSPWRAGHVHSVFERAVNIAWHDGGLVTFHGPGALAAPFAAALPAMPRTGALRAGLGVWREPGGLCLGGMEIGWEAAETVNLVLDSAPGPPDGVAVATREAAREGGSAGLSSEAGRRGQGALAHGIRFADTGAFIAGAQALVGLGEGLTPAGDDCLVGALAVLRRFGRGRLHPLATARDALVEAAARSTTAVSCAFLVHALDGEFSEVVADLLRAESPVDAKAAAGRLRAMGGTSGVDTLNGMRLAFEALEAVGA
jgi:hypothetical protein